MVQPLIDGSPLPARNRLADDVASRLREAIVEGRFPPDERIPEDRIADVLLVSRAPVREALVQLEREGLVVRRPYRGVYVARLAAADAWEVFSLRLISERLALESAARVATADDVTRLEEGLRVLAAAVEGTTPLPDVTTIDLDFHDLLYRAAHHERLYRVWSELRPQVHILLLSGWGTSPGEPTFAARMVTAHGELLDVVRDRDVERAPLLADAHVRRNYEAVVAALPRDAARIDRALPGGVSAGAA
jgi:DNA-binding GntR family transcriptional regulator